jgi:hypothetical protein
MMTTRVRPKLRSTLGRLYLCCGVLAGLAAFSPVPAQAQTVDDATRNAARHLAEAGVESYNRDEYDKAIDQLNRAYALLRVPSIGLWSARALAKSGRLIEANERYLEVTRMNNVTTGDEAIQRSAKADAKTEADAIAQRIPTIRFALSGAAANEVELRVDGVPVPGSLIGEPWPVNPGARTVQGKRGTEVVTVSVKLEEGGTAQAALHFTGSAPVAARAPSTPASPSAAEPVSAAPMHAGSAQRTAGWITLGVGGAGLAFGGVTGILLISKHHALTSSCQGTVCDHSKAADVSSFNSLRTLSSVGLIAGAALTVTGATLLLTAPSMHEAPSAEAYLGVSELGLRGRF